jgi:hypothetical protein
LGIPEPARMARRFRGERAAEEVQS